MAVATVDSVATSLGRPITDALEVAQVNQWLDDAELKIRLRLGDTSLLDQDALAYVEREAVILKIRNPDGHENEKIDDYSFGLSPAQASGQVHIIDEWWEMLSPTTEAGAFTIRPTYVADDLATMNAWWAAQ